LYTLTDRVGQNVPTLAQLSERARSVTVKCPACRHGRILPLRDLIDRHGATARAVDLLPRFHCGACGARPVWTWIDYPETPAFGGYPAMGHRPRFDG
jgi:hypothetical protein